MSVSKSYVHVLSTDADALVDFVEDIESSFLELGIAPDVSRPRELPLSDARAWAQTQPGKTSADGWFPYLTREFVRAVDATAPAKLQYAGVSGMTVVGRVLRETTGAHADVILQTHTYTKAPTDYTVHQYDTTAEEYVPVASGTYGQ
jgi:hypothetical protein